MPRPDENPGQSRSGGQGSERSDQAKADRDLREQQRTARKSAREQYRDQWRTDHPGEEFPGFPPELEGSPYGEGDDDDEVNVQTGEGVQTEPDPGTTSQ